MTHQITATVASDITTYYSNTSNIVNAAQANIKYNKINVMVVLNDQDRFILGTYDLGINTAYATTDPDYYNYVLGSELPTLAQDIYNAYTSSTNPVPNIYMQFFNGNQPTISYAASSAIESVAICGIPSPIQ